MFDGWIYQLRRLCDVEIERLHADRNIRDLLKQLVTSNQQIAAAMPVFVAELQQLVVAQNNINAVLTKIQQELLTPQHAVGLEITWFDGNGKPIFRGNGMPVQLTDIQSVSATVSEVDAVGNPVPLDTTANTVAWAVSDSTILTLTQNPDGSASFKAAGKIGSCQVTVSVTPNAGGTALNAQDTVNVVASAATGLAIQFGTPA